MKNMILGFIVVIAACGVAGADTLQFRVDNVYKDADGTQLLDFGSLGLLVADKDGDQDWAAYDNISADSFLADDGDVIIASWAMEKTHPFTGSELNGQWAGDIQWDPASLDLPTDGGYEVLMVWFDMPYASDLTGPGAEGIRYGKYRNAEFVAPGVATVAVDDLNGQEVDLSADFVTVPEPFTVGVLAVGGLAMLRRRRAA